MRSIVIPLFFIVILLSGCTFNQNKPGYDVLLVWGQRQSDEPCLVWFVDPAQQIAEQALTEVDRCSFNVVTIGGVQHLIYKEYPNKIIIYNVDAINRKLTVQEVVTLHNIGDFFSWPQWDREGNIYFDSATPEGSERIYREQIYRVDKETKTTTSFIRHEPGLAASPIISPDGRFLVYWTLDGPPNRNAGPNCPNWCAYGYYHVFDLEQHKDIPLLPFIRQIREEQLAISHHENAVWSPTGQFLAFQRSVRGSGGIVIFDVRNSEIVADIPSDGGNDTEIVQWYSDNELIYIANRYFPELGYGLGRPFSYSLDSKASQELLPDLPSKSEDGYPHYFYEIYLPFKGDQLVGVISGRTEGATISLFIADLSQRPPRIDAFYSDNELPYVLFQGDPFQKLAGSMSGEWIAYQSIYSVIEDGSTIRDYADLHIMGMNGQLISISEGITGVLSHSLQYAWVQSR
jgi:Tol biopolymer transport system component